MTAGRRGVWAPVAAAVAAALWVGVSARDIAYIWDDFLILRPHSWTELKAVWAGSWDPTGQLTAFYRPLAIWANAAGFALAGFHPWRLLAIMLLELAAGAALLGRVIARESGSASLGAFAAAAYALHPSIATAAGPIWFEQNHRWSTILVAAAFLAWQRVRHRTEWHAWWPVHACVWLGSLFKEDVLMTLPVIVGWQWWRSRHDPAARPVRWRTLAPWAVFWVGWMAVRWWLLGTIAGEPVGGTQTLAEVLPALAVGPYSVLVRHRTLYWDVFPGHLISSVVPAAIGLWALLRYRRLDGTARQLIGAGIIAFAGFDLLLALGSSETRYHLLVVATIIALAGAVRAVSAAPRWRMWAAVAILAALAAGSTATLRDLAPCTDTITVLDASSNGWFEELRMPADHWSFLWLRRKAQLCAEGRAPSFIEAMPDVAARATAGRHP